MKRLSIKQILFLLLTAFSFAPDKLYALEYYYATTGGTMVGSHWIVAEGEIKKGDTERFRDFVKKLGNCGEVKFNSPGGSLNEGLQLGIAIRELCYSTSVGKTKKIGVWAQSKDSALTVYQAESFDGTFDEQRGVCASACVYAFMGGKTRHIAKEKSALYVHQFYSESGLATPDEKKFDFKDLSSTQMTMGVLVSYLSFLDVDTRLAAIAAKIPATSVYELTEKDVQELRVRRSASTFSEPKIEATNSGFVVSLTNLDRASLDIRCIDKNIIRFTYRKKVDNYFHVKSNEDAKQQVNSIFEQADEFYFAEMPIKKSQIKVLTNQYDLFLVVDVSTRNNLNRFSSLTISPSLPTPAINVFGFYIPYSKTPQLLKSISQGCS